MQVIDISDPSAPRWAGGSDVSGIHSADLFGNFAYVTQQGGFSILELAPSRPPISIRRTSDQIVISWDSAAGENFKLQQNDSMRVGSPWQDITVAPERAGNEFTVGIPNPAGNAFYRLFHP